MKYLDLIKEIESMTDEQKNCDVTVYIPGVDEFHPVDVISFSSNSQILNDGHPILNIDELN